MEKQWHPEDFIRSMNAFQSVSFSFLKLSPWFSLKFYQIAFLSFCEIHVIMKRWCIYKWLVDIYILPLHSVYMGLSLCFLLSLKDQNKDKIEHKAVPLCWRLEWYQRQWNRLSVREAIWILPPHWFPVVKVALAFLHTWRKPYSLRCHICEIELFDDNAAVK